MDGVIGRFTIMDRHEGDSYDPITLHKYSFSQNDPVNNNDPSGYDVKWGSRISEIFKGGVGLLNASKGINTYFAGGLNKHIDNLLANSPFAANMFSKIDNTFKLNNRSLYILASNDYAPRTVMLPLADYMYVNPSANICYAVKGMYDRYHMPIYKRASIERIIGHEISHVYRNRLLGVVVIDSKKVGIDEQTVVDQYENRIAADMMEYFRGDYQYAKIGCF
jgi:hypothetical protein